jgi:hypothetical protein
MTLEDLDFEFPDWHLRDTAPFATKIRKAGHR